jgi:peroxiredoxin
MPSSWGSSSGSGQKIMDMYREFGIDVARLQGSRGWLLPIPATLVVGSDGRVKARLIDPDFRHRVRIEDILKTVCEAAKS